MFSWTNWLLAVSKIFWLANCSSPFSSPNFWFKCTIISSLFLRLYKSLRVAVCSESLMMQRLLSDYDRELPPMNGNIRLQASVMQLSIWPQMIGTDADRNSACHWGHPYKLYKAQCENSKRRNFFTERIVNVWNSLPANVDFSSLPRFKQSVEQVDFHSFCSVISYNHIVRFWLHYIFYYFVCVFVCFSSLFWRVCVCI